MFWRAVKFFKTGRKTFGVNGDIFDKVFAVDGPCGPAALKNGLRFKCCSFYLVGLKKGNG